MKKNSTPVGSKHDYRRVCRTKNISTMIYPTRTFVEKGRKKNKRAESQHWGSEISLRQIHVRKFNSDNLYPSLIDFNLLILHFNQSHSPPTEGIKTGRFSSRALKVISAILTLDNHMAISQCGHLLLFGSYAKLLFPFEGACNPYEKEEFGYLWTTLIAIFSMQVKLACDSR